MYCVLCTFFRFCKTDINEYNIYIGVLQNSQTVLEYIKFEKHFFIYLHLIPTMPPAPGSINPLLPGPGLINPILSGPGLITPILPRLGLINPITCPRFN